MSDFCRQVKADESAFAICQYMAEDMGYSPSSDITPVDIYAAAIDAAEREQDADHERAAKSVFVDDNFEFDSPFACFLSQRGDMRIPWLFSDCSEDRQAEWYFERVVAKIDSLKKMAISDGFKPGSAEYKKTLALDIFDFIRKPAKRGGMGIVFDEEQKDPEKNALEIIQAGKATCIEFAILYIALANLAGIDAKPVQVNYDNPITPSDHTLVGIELAGDDVLFMDLMVNDSGVFSKQRPDARWIFMSRLDLLSHDYDLRALMNGPAGEADPCNEYVKSKMLRALSFSPGNHIGLSNLGQLELICGGNLERSLNYFLMSEKARPEDPHTKGMIKIVKAKM